jgi:threonine/homoserine/homoserine lactone efflux protein
MSLELLLAFNLALLAAIVSPGPAMLVSIRTTLVHGRFAGIKTGLGLGLMAAIWTMMALLGLNSIFEIFPWAYITIKTIGAIYLLYIAWNTWKSAKQPLNSEVKIGKNHFRDGVLLNLSNPKSVLFAAAVLVLIFPPDLTLFEKTVIVVNHFLVEIACYTIFAVTMSTEAVSKQYMKAKTWLDRFSAIVLGGLGIKLLIQK